MGYAELYEAMKIHSGVFVFNLQFVNIILEKKISMKYSPKHFIK